MAQIDGTSGNDTLTGTSADDVINGYEGDDTIVGGGGSDVVDAGDGSAVITTGAGNDTISAGYYYSTQSNSFDIHAGAGDDSIDVYAGTGTIDGGDGNNTVNLYDGSKTYIGGSGDDIVNRGIFFEANAGSYVVQLGDGNNVANFASTAESDTITSGSGNDTISTGAAADSVAAGGGDNLISIGEGGGIVTAGEGNDSVTGGSGSHVIDVGGGSNTVTLGDGDDTINAAGTVLGNDSIVSGNGSAVITTGAGNDTISAGYYYSTQSNSFDIHAGAGDDSIDVYAGTGTIDGGDGNNTVNLYDGSKTYIGGSGDDIVNRGIFFEANAGSYVVQLGDGNNVANFASTAESDTITSGSGNDTISTGAAADSVAAGGGDNLISIGEGGGIVTAGEGNDSVTGGSGSHVIDVGGGSNTVTLGDGDDTINAAGTVLGNDSIVSGDGSAVITTGAGNDTISAGYYYSTQSNSFDIHAGAGDDSIDVYAGTGTIDGGDGNNTVNLYDGSKTYIGGSGDDIVNRGIFFEANAGSYVVQLGDGNNVANFASTAESDTITSGSGNDTISTGAAADSVAAGGGDNLISIGEGGGIVTAGEGNDSVTGGSGSHVIDVGGGSNTVTLGDGDDTINAAGTVLGNDSIVSGNGSAVITTGAGNDTISAGYYYSTQSNSFDIHAGAGDDSIDVYAGTGTIDGGDGNNTVNLYDGSKTYIGGSGDDIVNRGNFFLANAGSYVVQLGDGNNVAGFAATVESDTIVSGSGNDTISTGSGNDLIVMGGGNDVATGGLGNDTFVYSGGNDTIGDFQDPGVVATDIIQVDMGSAYNSFAALQAIMSQDGGDALLTFSSGNVLRISNVDYTALDSSDFGFGPAPTLPGGGSGGGTGAAENDTISTFTDEDYSATVAVATLLANDTGMGLSVTGVSGTSNKGATVTLSGGTITYDPTGSAILNALGQGATTTDSFTYTVTGGDMATVTVGIAGVNDAPTAQTVTRSGSGTIAFTAADFTSKFQDVDTGDSLQSIKIASLPADGTLALGGTAVTANQVVLAADFASLTFTPNSGFSGATSFGWQAGDGTAFSTTAQVSLAIGASAGAAADDTISTLTDEDHAAPIAVADLLANDTGTGLSVTGVSGTSFKGATVTLSGGTINYDPSGSTTLNALGQGSTGTDSFTYTVTGGSTATVTVGITGVNDAPTAQTVTRSGTGVIAFTAADFTSKFQDVDTGDSLQSIKIASLPANGTLALSGIAVTANQVVLAADVASLTFTPNSGFSGTTSFGWQAGDGTAFSATAQASLTLTAAAGGAVDDDLGPITDEDTAIIIDPATLLANDGAGLTVTGVSGFSAKGAKLTFANGEITYDPSYRASSSVPTQFDPLPVGGSTTDTFTYTTSNGSTATATVGVTGVNDAPTLQSILLYDRAANPIAFKPDDFISHFHDIDGDAVQAIRIYDLPDAASGSLTFNGAPVAAGLEIAIGDVGGLVFTPTYGFTGFATFNYTASDGTIFSPIVLGATISMAPLVPVDTVGGASSPTVVALAGGGFVVSSVDNVTARFQVFDADGNALGAPVLETGLIETNKGTLSALTGGGFVFSWVEQDATTSASYFQIFNDSGSPIGSRVEIQAPAYTQYRPGFAGLLETTTVGLSNGDFAALYQDSATGDLVGQIYSATGTPIDGAFTLDGSFDSSIDTMYAESRATRLSGGGFAVTWMSEDHKFHYGVYDNGGSPISGDLLLPSHEGGETSGFAAIAGFGDGRFVVAHYEGPGSNKNNSLYYQLFSATGEPVSAILQVDTTHTEPFDAYGLAVTADRASNTFFVTWVAVGNLGFQDQIWGQRFYGDGKPGGDPFQVSDISSVIYTSSDVLTSGKIATFYGDQYQSVAGKILNGNPTATTDILGAITNEDTSVTIDPATLLLNDTDPDTTTTISFDNVLFHDSDPWQISALGAKVQVVNGQIVYNPSGSTLLNGMSGSESKTDSFTYYIRDGHGFGASGTVVVEVTGVNDLPVVTDFARATDGTGALALQASDFAAQFTDPDTGDIFQGIRIDSVSAHGTLLLNGNVVGAGQAILAADLAGLSFQPDANFNGTTSFSWSGYDGTGYSVASAEATITVTNNYGPPVALDDDLGPLTTEFATVTIAPSTLLANDSDPDPAATLAITAVSGTTAKGATVRFENGQIVYDPTHSAILDALPVGATVADTFTYTVTDSHGLSSTATVSIGVTGGDHSPVTSDFTRYTTVETALALSYADFLGAFTDQDGDALASVTIRNLPSNGTLLLNGSPIAVDQVLSPAELNHLTFAPAAGYKGAASFSWQGSDQYGAPSAQHVVTISVEPVSVSPELTALANGGFAVTWGEYSAANHNYKILEQRYNSDGSASGATVTVASNSSDGASTMAVLADGRYVVGWTTSDAIFHIQAYDSTTGNAVGAASVIPLDIGTSLGQPYGYDSRQRIAALADGGFLVAYDRPAIPNHAEVGGYGDVEDVYVQRFDASGLQVGNEIMVNTFWLRRQFLPSIAVNGDGDAFVAWDGFIQDDVTVPGDAQYPYNNTSNWANSGAYGAVLDGQNAFSLASGDIHLTSSSVGMQTSSEVAALSDGSFIVVGFDAPTSSAFWTRITQSGSSSIVTASGTVASGIGTTLDPSVTATSDGFIVTYGIDDAYNTSHPENHQDLYSRRYHVDVNGAVSAEAAVRSAIVPTTEYLSAPATDVLNNGSLAIASIHSSLTHLGTTLTVTVATV